MSAGPARRSQPELRPTRCAICDREGDASELWPATFDAASFSPRVFSARRMPDGTHYRIVKCRTCGLVRSDPIADASVLAELYAASAFEYDRELEGITATYARALRRLEARSPRRERLLEVGCGNGFFLAHTLRHGWHDVRGVEPSAEAVAKAAQSLRGRIIPDVMRPGLFDAETFDAVCLFQVLDHVPDPVALLEECLRVMRPGGHVLALNHDVSAWSARLLGERSPIVDIEHTYLYSPATMRLLFTKAGFVEAETWPVHNTYSLAYLAQLTPLPQKIKLRLLPRLRAGRAGRAKVTVPLGNLCLVARKPL